MNYAWKHIIVALVLGGVLGFVGARTLGSYCGYRHHWKPGQFQARLLARFSSKLNLNPEQKTKVATILEAKRQKIEALRAEFQPKFKEIRNSTMAEIRPLLTPDQQQRFNVMNAKWEERAKRCNWGQRER